MGWGVTAEQLCIRVLILQQALGTLHTEKLLLLGKQNEGRRRVSGGWPALQETCQHCKGAEDAFSIPLSCPGTTRMVISIPVPADP